MLEIKDALIDNGNIIKVDIVGYIDSNTAPEFESKITEILSRNIPKILLNCTGVTFISSAGIGVFMVIRRTLDASNGRLVLLGVSDEIKNVFNLLGFIKFFTMMDSEDECISYLNSSGDSGGATQPSGAANKVNIQFPAVIGCPKCGGKLKVPKPAKYRCAKCKAILDVSSTGDVKALS